jgi:hypothetical protein
MFHEELEIFDPSVRISGVHDDIVDATSDAFMRIKTERIAKPFTLPNISSPTKLSRYKSSGH